MAGLGVRAMEVLARPQVSSLPATGGDIRFKFMRTLAYQQLILSRILWRFTEPKYSRPGAYWELRHQRLSGKKVYKAPLDAIRERDVAYTRPDNALRSAPSSNESLKIGMQCVSPFPGLFALARLLPPPPWR